MKGNNHHRGFTLVELMVTVAIVGVLAGIAIPAYNGYTTASKMGVVSLNLEQFVLFEEAYFYENETYLAGSYVPLGADTLTVPLNWKPTGDNNLYSYTVTAGTCGSILQCYTVTITHVNDATITVTESRP